MEHSDFFPDCFHRVSIKGLCVKDGKLLLIKEPKAMSGKWEMPGGGLDFGEDFHTALKREVKEELGLKVTKISKNPLYVWTYRYPANSRNIGWYYSLVLAYRIELENLEFTPTDECEDIGLFSKEELKSVELNRQAEKLVEIFDPKDFEQPL